MKPQEAFEPELEELLDRHAQAFERAYGPGGKVRLFFAPGRVNLMGAHLDYNGGPVMPMAIDRGTFVALRPRKDRLLVMRSTSESGEFRFDLDAAPRAATGNWVDYPLGVALEVFRESPRAVGLEVLFGGNLPVGAGLSSSASICVGTAFSLDKVWGLELTPFARVEAALRAERQFVGVQCGIMDPYAVGLAKRGHLLWLDCKDASIEHLPIDHRAVRIAVADTGVRRELAAGAFNQRVTEARRAFEALRGFVPGSTHLRDVSSAVFASHADELDPVLRARARHVVHEVERTFAARDALLSGDVERFGRAMFETHVSLRDHYQVSVPELDCLVEAAAREPGVLGARLTGAGFGGCVVMLLRAGAEVEVAERVSRAFEQAFQRPARIEVFRGDPGPREWVR
ncbi:MAG: galactokinase [Planctomycetes bacterium]|nr:galactokinase [Planctomycetota bacterium]